MEKENFTTVSFEELWSELSGSTQFGQDELIEMISLQDDDNKDFSPGAPDCNGGLLLS